MGIGRATLIKFIWNSPQLTRFQLLEIWQIIYNFISVALRDTKRVLVFTDSIGKYLEDIWYMELVAVRGARINSMKTIFKNKEIHLSLYSHIIIHLGANDVVIVLQIKLLLILESSFFLLKVLIVWLKFYFIYITQTS